MIVMYFCISDKTHSNTNYPTEIASVCGFGLVSIGNENSSQYFTIICNWIDIWSKQFYAIRDLCTSAICIIYGFKNYSFIS